MRKKTSSYSKKVLQYFKKPKNYGKIKNPDGVGKVGNIVCGDVMWLYIKVSPNQKGREIIKDIRFETFGCVAALATSSVITELAKGKSLKEALQIDRNEVVEALGSLPPVKIHCSVLAADALSEAIYNYYSKKQKKIPAQLFKKHQRIEKERKLIEEKYKDWVQAEEKIHGQE